MKFKKIITATLSAALALSTALALTACKSKTEQPSGPTPLGTTDSLNIDNYIYGLSDFKDSLGTGSETSYTAVEKWNSDGDSVQPMNNGSFLLIQSENGNMVYSVELDKTVATGFRYYDGMQESVYFKDRRITIDILRGTNGDYSYTYFAPDGTVLAADSQSSYLSVNTQKKYIGNDKTQSTVLSVQRYTGYSYFLMTEDDAGIIHYSALDSDDVHNYCVADYEVGEYLTKPMLPVYESTADRPINGNIADFKYVEYDDKYEFYCNGNLSGTVSFEYGNVFGFVGNYMYYEINSPVSPEATSGYNYVVQKGNVTRKYNYRLYRYDIVANSTAELNYDFKFQDNIEALYNEKTKSYDAAFVTGYASANGVFVEQEGASITLDKDYLVDSRLNVAIDFSDKVGAPVFKLDDNKYLSVTFTGSGMFIADNNFGYVTSVDTLDPNAQLIKFGVNGLYGLKDYDGKIIVAPDYTAIGAFYGGYAIATKNTDNGAKRLLLNKTGKETPMPENSENDGMNVTVGTPVNGLYVVTTQANNRKKSDVFNYEGTLIASFAESDAQIASIGNKTFIIVNNQDWYLAK